MKVTWSWLTEHLETDKTPQEVAALLTCTGTETEISSAHIGEDFSVVRVENVEHHPHADTLSVCTVHHKGRNLTIVCGASNVRVGMHTIVALPGQILPGTDKPLTQVTLRGIESQGMLCSAEELQVGLPCTEGGILDLSCPVGTLLSELVNADPLLDLEVTPNRGDLLSVRGIARECVALGAGKLVLHTPNTYPVSDQLPIRVETSACKQFYMSSVQKISTLPEIMGQRLISIGMSSISPVVNLTNYLAHDLGQPMHAFDADKIMGQMTIRLSQKGERFEGLDKNIYVLPEGILVMTDDQGIISILGILGGLRTAWDASSTNLLLEAAEFDPSVIARGGQLLKIFTNARFRCERGIDPHLPRTSLFHATDMLGGGEIWGKNFSNPQTKSIRFSSHLLSQITGVTLSEEEIENRFTTLGCTFSRIGENLDITPPTWRNDWSLPEDCVEELIRVKGYTEITAAPFPFRPHTLFVDPQEQKGWRARRFCVLKGCCEVVTWSFMETSKAELFTVGKLVKISNPLSQELSIMRPSILPNLLDNALYHKKNGISFLPLFEWGPQFFGTEPGEQEDVLAAIFPIDVETDWQAHPGMTFFDLKGLTESLLRECGLYKASFESTAPLYYHPGHSGCFVHENTVIATLGEIHPRLHKIFPLKVWMLEVFLSRLPSHIPMQRTDTIPTLQPVEKDLSFFLECETPVGPFIETLQKEGGDLLLSVRLIDLFITEKKSITVRCTFQPREQTLSDIQLHHLMDHLIQCARTQGAELRGEWD